MVTGRIKKLSIKQSSCYGSVRTPEQGKERVPAGKVPNQRVFNSKPTATKEQRKIAASAGHLENAPKVQKGLNRKPLGNQGARSNEKQVHKRQRIWHGHQLLKQTLSGRAPGGPRLYGAANQLEPGAGVLNKPSSRTDHAHQPAPNLGIRESLSGSKAGP